MDVDRNVILDLLPLYLSDEASPETRTLVEARLAQDPDLSRLAEQWRRRLPQPAPPPISPDAEAQAFLQARRALNARIVTLAIVISTGVLALAAVALIGAMMVIRG